jgi:Fructose-bisphosphate aldolase class-II
MNYIVFPGNVGDKDSLLKAAITLGVAKKAATSPGAKGPKSPQAASPQPSHSIPATKSKLLVELSKAQSKGYAVAAFNVYNLEGAKAVVAAAEISRSPVILQVMPRSETSRFFATSKWADVINTSLYFL